MQEATGRTIRLFLIDGTPTGLVSAEVINWTGRVLAASRSDLAAALGRSEARRPGVYFLLAEEATAGLPDVYIGESDNVAERIKTHDTNREFDRFCIVTSKDANLTKAHILYLESRLLERCKGSGRARLLNGRSSDNRSLPESEQADMEYFLQQLALILPAVGFDILSPKIASPSAIESEPIASSGGALKLMLSPSAHPNLATAIAMGNEVTVLTGSRALKQEFSLTHYKPLRDELIADGRITLGGEEDPYATFTQDVTFKSPSAAAAVVLNRNANGRVEWKIDDGSGRTLKDWQDAQVAAVDIFS